MKIFISWSGNTSMEIAEALKKWLPKVLQAIKPYYTPNDIDKGTKWQGDILENLNECSIGIICLTPENLEKPWILFEAGALSNRLENAKVCPILFGISKVNVKGPLGMFQATDFEREDFRKLIHSLNAGLGTAGITIEVLNDTFDMFFPMLEREISEIINRSKSKYVRRVERTDRELLEELLELTRGINREKFQSDKENTLTLSLSEEKHENRESFIIMYNNIIRQRGKDFESKNEAYDVLTRTLSVQRRFRKMAIQKYLDELWGEEI